MILRFNGRDWQIMGVACAWIVLFGGTTRAFGLNWVGRIGERGRRWCGGPRRGR